MVIINTILINADSKAEAVGKMAMNQSATSEIEQTTKAAIIRDPRGHWLWEGTVPLGHRFAWRERRCQKCYHQRQAAHPIVFIREDGEALVIMWPCPVDASQLPWPDMGWRQQTHCE